MPTLKDWLKSRALGLTGGITSGGSPDQQARLTFICNEDQIVVTKLREYDTWYKGDGDELLNLYNRNTVMDFNYEPWYWKNKRSYYWSVSSTEDDIKRTHSGQPANIVNTLVNIVGKPIVSVPDADVDSILEDTGFWRQYSEKQMPMTLVEGWGCWKTSWDLSVSDHPYESYYRAQDCDFIWKAGKVIGIIFRDWYQGYNEQERYLVTEFRYFKPRRDENTGRITRDTIIETEAWKVAGGDQKQDMELTKADLTEIPELASIEGKVVINDMDSLLAQPCIFYKDATDDRMPGKSIFHNKLDLFDDLDQELSQQANCIGKSTPEELFNSDFLERDQKTGLPVQPHRYDRKFTMFSGGRTVEGTTNTAMPVQTTQPNLDFTRFGAAVTDTMSEILSGVMSPATMGIGVSVQATAESQREKEKVTISTRNHIIDSERPILSGVVTDLLMAEEYIRTGNITKHKYDVSLKWSEFADESFEDKATVLSGLLDNGDISPKMYLDKLYGDSLSDEEYSQELEYLEKMHNPDQGGMGRDAMGGDPNQEAMMLPVQGE